MTAHRHNSVSRLEVKFADEMKFGRVGRLVGNRHGRGNWVGAAFPCSDFGFERQSGSCRGRLAVLTVGDVNQFVDANEAAGSQD